MNCKLINPIIAALVVVALFFVSTAEAGEIRVHNTDPSKILFVGAVEEGDVAMLVDVLANNDGIKEIAFHSGGGSVNEGIALMAMIKLHGLNTVVLPEMDCLSICSFMWLAGTERRVEELGRLGVHQPYAPHTVATEMGAEAYATMVMQTVAWMMYMVKQSNIEVNDWWWVGMLSTEPSDMYILTREDLTLFEVK